MLGHLTPLADWLVILPVLLGLGGGAVLLVLRARVGLQRWVCLVVLAAMLASDARLLQRTLVEGPVAMTMGNWRPPFGITFAADAFGAGFALFAVVLALGAWMSMAASTPERALRAGVYPLFLVLLAGVHGAVLTGDLFNLYVWFEVMLIASFGLMALAGGPLQLDGAIKYGVANLVGTTLLLAGLGLFYGTVGTLNMADAIAAARGVDHAVLTAIAALLLFSFVVKAAMFPVGTWLAASYHAPPATISSIVGALLTKVGVYALLRVAIMVLPETSQTLALPLGVAAGLTMLIGPLSALAETNLRRAVGFLLVGGVGTSVICFSQLNGETLAGSVAYTLHAILTVGALYLVTGLIEQACGTQLIPRMGGLSRSGLSAALFLLLLAMAGIPPFLGFWPKLLLLQGLLAGANYPVVFLLLANSLLTLVAGLRIWSRLAWRPSLNEMTRPQGIAGAAFATAIVVVLGLAPGLLLQVSQDAARGLLDPSAYVRAVGLSP